MDIMPGHKHRRHKYVGLILAVVLIAIIAAASYLALGYYKVLGYRAIKTQNSPITVLTTIASTSTQSSTTIPTTACYAGYPYEQVYVGNSISCGLFQLQLLNVMTNGTTVRLYYKGKLFVNQTTIVGDQEIHYNISGTVLYIYVGGASVNPTYADIGLSINSGIVSVTVETTSSKTTASTAPTTSIATISSTSIAPTTSSTTLTNTTSVTTSLSITSLSTTSTIPPSENQSYQNSTFIEIPNSNYEGSRFTYVPIATTNVTTIEFICSYFPAGYQNPGYGSVAGNFSSIYTLQGQLQTANYGESLHESSATFQMYNYGVTCN